MFTRSGAGGTFERRLGSVFRVPLCALPGMPAAWSAAGFGAEASLYISNRLVKNAIHKQHL